jgi:hypothetical protein
MKEFSKDNYDVSRMFLAYLALAGDSYRTSIAVGVPEKVIEVIAEKESWATKLKNIGALRRGDSASEVVRQIDRVANFYQARLFRDLITRALEILSDLRGRKTILTLITKRSPRTGRKYVDLEPIQRLVQAAHTAQALTYRGLEDPVWMEMVSPIDKGTRDLRDGIWKALTAMDQIQGLDSVGMVREQLNQLDRPAPQERPAPDAEPKAPALAASHNSATRDTP